MYNRKELVQNVGTWQMLWCGGGWKQTYLVHFASVLIPDQEGESG